MPRSETTHVDRENKEALIKRLNRIGGQVEGLTRMVAEGRYCIDILTQIAAVRAALDALGREMLHDHAHGCLKDAVRSGRGDHAIDELMRVVARLAR